MVHSPARSAAGFLIWPVLLFALVTAAAQANTAAQLDARILIDVSGSMKQNDPRNLRRSALRLMVGLMPTGMNAGIWSFGQYINMQVSLGRVDGGWKELARAEAEKIHSRGLFTNIEGVLQRASADWKSVNKNEQRHLILLTDGMVDISKDPAANAASRERIIKDIMPRLKALGVRVHTIALSERADHELMRNMAAETGGWYEQVNDSEQLQRVFLRIFEKVGNPDTVPLKDNRFKVDASVQEATLLVFRRQDTSTPTRIHTPGGKEFGAGDAPATVKWHEDDGYDLLTISEPEVGVWTVRAEVDPDNRVIVVTDLQMKTSELPNRLVQGEQVPLTIQFQDHGKLITRKAFLDVMALTAEQKGADGISERQSALDDGQGGDEAAGDGLFSARLITDVPAGRNELVITAEGKTFVREKRHTFELLSPASLEVAESDQNGKAVLTIVLTPDSEILHGQSLAVQAWLEGAGGGRSELNMQPDAMGVWRVQVDPAGLQSDQQLRVNLAATTALGYPIELNYEPITIKAMLPPVKAVAEPAPIAEVPAGAAEANAGLDEGVVDLAIVAAVNVGLVVLGLGWLVVARRRKKRDPIRLVADEEEHMPVGEQGVAAEIPDVDDLIDLAIDESRGGESAADDIDIDIDDLIDQSVDEARSADATAAVDEAPAEVATAAEDDVFAEVGDDPFAGLAEEMNGQAAAAPTESAPRDGSPETASQGLDELMGEALEEGGEETLSESEPAEADELLAERMADIPDEELATAPGEAIDDSQEPTAVPDQGGGMHADAEGIDDLLEDVMGDATEKATAQVLDEDFPEIGAESPADDMLDALEEMSVVNQENNGGDAKV